MAHRNGLIYGDVSSLDVSLVLLEPTSNLGKLCQSSCINKYALYKPEDYNTISPITEEQRRLNNRSLRVETFTNARDAAKRISASGEMDWEYLRPKGGWNSPFRLKDFQGYDHTAQRWFDFSLDRDDYDSIRFSGLNSINSLPDWMRAFEFLRTNNGASAYIGFVLFRKDADENVRNAGLYVISSYVDIIELHKKLAISHEVVRDGWYSGDCFAVPVVAILSAIPREFPAIINSDIDSNMGILYPLPSTPLLIHIKTEAESIDNRYFTGFELTFEGAGTADDTSWSFNGVVIASRSEDAWPDTSVHIGIDFYVESAKGTSMEDKFLGSMSATLSPGQSARKGLSGTAEYIAEPPKRCRIKCEVMIADNPSFLNAQRQTIYIFIENSN